MENSATAKPLIYDVHSTPHLYQGVDETDLRLEIHEYGLDALHVKLVNKHYFKQKSAFRKYFALFMLALCSYVWLHLSLSSFRLLYMEVLLIFWVILLVWRLFNIVESENFLYCFDFGIYLQIQRLTGTSSTFIASANIHDVRINEVIENLDFRYLLIIRTKGKLFKKHPIIPIFKVFKPTCDCLSLVYKHLNKVLLKETTPPPSSSTQ